MCVDVVVVVRPSAMACSDVRVHMCVYHGCIFMVRQGDTSPPVIYVIQLFHIFFIHTFDLL